LNFETSKAGAVAAILDMSGLLIQSMCGYASDADTEENLGPGTAKKPKRSKKPSTPKQIGRFGAEGKIAKGQITTAWKSNSGRPRDGQFGKSRGQQPGKAAGPPRGGKRRAKAQAKRADAQSIRGRNHGRNTIRAGRAPSSSTVTDIEGRAKRLRRFRSHWFRRGAKGPRDQGRRSGQSEKNVLPLTRGIFPLGDRPGWLCGGQENNSLAANGPTGGPGGGEHFLKPGSSSALPYEKNTGPMRITAQREFLYGSARQSARQPDGGMAKFQLGPAWRG